ncbi:MAG: hypothetical protein ACYYK0_06790 [Candidatus Eutrophobiaceae bacterium]
MTLNKRKTAWLACAAMSFYCLLPDRAALILTADNGKELASRKQIAVETPRKVFLYPPLCLLGTWAG